MHFCCLCFRTNGTGSIQIIIQLQSNSSGFCKRQKYVKTMSMSAKRIGEQWDFQNNEKDNGTFISLDRRPNAQHYRVSQKYY